MNLILIYKIPTKYDTEYVRYNRNRDITGNQKRIKLCETKCSNHFIWGVRLRILCIHMFDSSF